MGQAIESLARLVAETRWDDVPEAVRRHAKLVLLDTMGVILAGSQQPELRALRQQLAIGAGAGATILARGFPTTDPRVAAFANGTAGRSIELCESHRFVACQAAVQVFPGVFAAAESRGSSGRDMLLALILGYDVAIRLGAGTTQRPLAHQNGQTALIGAIAGASRLRGLDAEQTSGAMRIGATFVLVPSYTNAVDGATTLNAAGGMSGLAGGLVTDLAEAGFLAQADAIEEALTHLVADRFEPERVTEALGERWEITRNAFRLRACCIPTYASLDALEAALAELGAPPEAIARIDIATYRFASAMRSQQPRNGFAARYSLPHAAAAIVLRGSAGIDSFAEETVRDPAFVALRARVHVSEDPALTAMFPASKPGRVTVTLQNEQQVTRQVDSARGDFQRPYAESEIREKFRALAGRSLTEAGVAALEHAIDATDEWSDVRCLAATLRAHSRAECGD
ncbi:MmgE/PrpD family protein [Humitalea sp. 24SJ18S-53]|uniref:MmgE/PrpD family protein n=1 Tax=Humitalea sp. 24SJ18S-53 TaxID=3422307 RepID=UPI003D67BC8C